uniref:putative bifunctional diguanylate cyclase/phosphodiesterase n=1 Tax=Thaumasiovibrio occultus TaxID=1891184 RepID=UPI00131EA924|nr:EAL domain-containing protein [Thaumasiovibrio occultus]
MSTARKRNSALLIAIAVFWIIASAISLIYFPTTESLLISILLLLPGAIAVAVMVGINAYANREISQFQVEANSHLKIRNRYQTLLDTLPDAAWVRTKDGTYLIVNREFTETIEMDEKGLAEKSAAQLVDFHAQRPYLLDDDEKIASGASVQKELNLRNPDGSYTWVELIKVPVFDEGQIVATAGIVRDISARKAAQNRLAFHANFDELTRLPNRNSLEKDLGEAISRYKTGDLLALCFLDLDKFKLVNDSIGHLSGDKVLNIVAQSLRLAVGNEGKVYRLSGDEFVVVFDKLKGVADLNKQVKTLIDSACQTCNIDSFEFNISASMGVSFYPDHGNDCWDLIRAADIAMCQAKQAGRKRYHFFTEEYAGLAFEHLSLEKRLRNALEHHEFFLRFQPIIDVDTNSMVAMEALVRWQDPENGEQEPVTFIPFAEQTGLITDIGDWVLEAAIRQQANWQKAGKQIVPMSVNVSSLQFFQPDFVARLATLLSETELDGEWLELELTESILMKHENRLLSTLKRIRSLGVSLSIDDFGTGYSSLSYLSAYPINKLKIDRTFVDMIDQRPDKVTITKSIIELGRNLNLTVVAEGVEREQEKDTVSLLGCAQIQGYLYSRPCLEAEIYDWLEAAEEQVVTL